MPNLELDESLDRTARTIGMYFVLADLERIHGFLARRVYDGWQDDVRPLMDTLQNYIEARMLELEPAEEKTASNAYDALKDMHLLHNCLQRRGVLPFRWPDLMPQHKDAIKALLDLCIRKDREQTARIEAASGKQLLYVDPARHYAKARSR